MKLKKHVVKEFGSKITQEMYRKKAEEGLWKSEEILIKRYFKKKSSVLDMGCGTGRTTIPLSKKYKVVGVDITPEMIKNAKKIAKSKGLKIRYEIGDATKLRFKDESFDNALFSNNGWTQIPGRNNRIKALKEIYRVLKPGGYYIFTTHVRKLKGFMFFWLKQWFKLNILKPLGFRVDEIDFGDRFFARETSGAQFEQKQYIHIPSINEVRGQLSDTGFEFVFMKQEHKIAKKRAEYSPMFYVYRKKKK